MKNSIAIPRGDKDDFFKTEVANLDRYVVIPVEKFEEYLPTVRYLIGLSEWQTKQNKSIATVDALIKQMMEAAKDEN